MLFENEYNISITKFNKLIIDLIYVCRLRNNGPKNHYSLGSIEEEADRKEFRGTTLMLRNRLKTSGTKRGQGHSQHQWIT